MLKTSDARVYYAENLGAKIVMHSLYYYCTIIMGNVITGYL